MTIQANQGFGVTIFGATGSGGGGSTSPGSPDTSVQFNSSGSFAGSASLTWNNTTKLLTATGLGTGGGANTGGLTISGGSVTMSGDISANAWTTNGIRYKGVSSTLTDLTSTGTVAAAYTNVYGGNTIAASNSTTYTDYFTTYINQPTAGTNVTFTNRWAAGFGGNVKITGSLSLGTALSAANGGTGLTELGTGVATALGNATNAASGLVALDSNQSLSITGATVTTSKPVLNLSQTWNAGAVTFTGLKFNVTDTASASGSLLLDLQVGGISAFKVTKTGVSTFGNASSGIQQPTLTVVGSDRSFSITPNAQADGMRVNGNLNVSSSSPLIRFAAASDAANYALISSNAAATLQLGAADAAAPVAQTLQVQSVVAGTSNTAGTNFTINGSKGTGTGAGGSIIFQVAPAGSSGTSQNAYQSVISLPSPINSASSLLTVGPSSTSGVISAGSNNFGNIQFGGVTYGANGHAAIRNDGSVVIRPAGGFSWVSTIDPAGGTIDLSFFRDAANTLALRNGANAQTYRIYATADGSPGSNFQRLTLSAGVTSNMAIVAADNGGTGVAMGLQFGAALTTGGGVTNIFNINTSGHMLWNTDNTYDIGASGVTRPRNVYAGSGVFGNGIYGTSIVQITSNGGRFDIGGDASIYRDAANTLALRNGTNNQTFNVYGSYTSTTNYQRVVIKTLREVSSALSGATYVSTIAIPAYALLVGVTTRVSTAITGATSYSVGDGTTANLWGNNIAVTLNSQSQTSDFTAVGAVGAAATSRTVTLTANGSNFTGGVVEICLHYLTTEAD